MLGSFEALGYPRNLRVLQFRYKLIIIFDQFDPFFFFFLNHGHYLYNNEHDHLIFKVQGSLLLFTLYSLYYFIFTLFYSLYSFYSLLYLLSLLSLLSFTLHVSRFTLSSFTLSSLLFTLHE